MFLLSSTLVVADETSELQESITATLVSATNDPDGDVRFAAFSALKDWPRSDAIVRAFRRGLEDDHTDVRLLALTKLVDYEGPTAEVLERLVSAIAQEDLASTAKKLLIRIGEPAAPRLIESLKSGKTKEKLVVADILGRLSLGKHRKEAVTEFTAILKDEDRDVRLAAISTLVRMAASQFGAIGQGYVDLAAQIFSRYDNNKDGVLTEGEWSKMRGGDVRAADSDNDGRITRQELAKYYRDRPSG